MADDVTGIVQRSQQRFAFVAINLSSHHEQRPPCSLGPEHVENRPVALFSGETYRIPPIKIIHRDRELRRRRGRREAASFETKRDCRSSDGLTEFSTIHHCLLFFPIW